MEEISNSEFMDKGEVAIKEGRRNILMFEDSDGNWRGMMHKNGVIVQERQIGPETVLQMLLTHE